MNWREMFKKYLFYVGEVEGAYFLYEGMWTPEEWAAIEAARLELEAEF